VGVGELSLRPRKVFLCEADSCFETGQIGPRIAQLRV
jgi:hypothetical protein